MHSKTFLAVTLLLGACAIPATPQATTRTLPSESDEIRSLTDMINGHRRRVGCTALVWNDEVAEVAEAHSRDMTRRNFFGHVNPDNRNPFQRLDAAGVKYRMAAENIAAGQRSGQEVFQSWLDSSGHRKNIENCALKTHGIGFVRSTTTVAKYGTIINAWTHVFVTN
jgi:uncharacterized protein YkwD